MTENNLRRYKVLLITLVLALVSYGAGIYVGKAAHSRGTGSLAGIDTTVRADISTSTISMEQFWEVWKTLDEKFVYTHKDAKKISDQDKIWGAIQGLTNAYGDPYTVFMPPEVSSNFQSNISGNFEGVGMELAVKSGSIIVISPLKDTPAYKAGVKKGDVVLAIDGKSTLNMTVDDAVKLIRGKAGTVVAIKFGRTGLTEPVEIKITRGVIDIPTIDTEIKGDVFIIRLYNFYALSADKFRLALREFVQSGKYKLILDLRGNPGGYLESAVDMASWFMPLGKVVVRESFGQGMDEQIYRSKGYAVFTDSLKMVILTDEGSASASEILAGALREQNGAKLVGTKTFGKGSVQELLKIGANTSLKVTVARWLTPNGLSISDNGLTPDYEVKISADDVKAGRDPQQDKAIAILDAK